MLCKNQDKNLITTESNYKIRISDEVTIRMITCYNYERLDLTKVDAHQILMTRHRTNTVLFCDVKCFGALYMTHASYSEHTL